MKDILRSMLGKQDKKTVTIRIDASKLGDDLDDLLEKINESFERDKEALKEVADKARDFHIEKYNKEVATAAISGMISAYCEINDMDPVEFTDQLHRMMIFEKKYAQHCRENG